MRYFLILGSLLTANILFAQDGFRTIEYGIQMQMLEDKPGKTAQIGDLVSLDMKYETEAGKVLKNTFDGGKPYLFPVKYSAFEGDLYAAMQQLSPGDSAKFLFSADSMYSRLFKKPMPAGVSSGSNLIFTIKVHEINSQKEYLNELKSYYKEHEEEIQAQKETQLKKEIPEIEKYIEKGGFIAEKTENGTYVMKFNTSDGKKPRDGQTVVFHFIGSFLDGAIFESSREIGKPLSIEMGANYVVPGLEEGLKEFSEGQKGRIVIPSPMGYGEKGKGDVIPPNKPLVFDVEIISIK